MLGVPDDKAVGRALRPPGMLGLLGQGAGARARLPEMWGAHAAPPADREVLPLTPHAT